MIKTAILLVLLNTELFAVIPLTSTALSGNVNLSATVTQSQNSIRGSVFDQSRRPVENLRVELLDEVEGVLATTYTSGSGQFVFYRLSSGTFQIRVLTTGTDYQSKTERVTIVGSIFGGRGAQSEQIDIILALRKDRARDATSISTSPSAVFVQEVPKAAREAYEKAFKGQNQGQLKENSLIELQRAVELFPNYFAALDLLGQEYIKRENYAVALPILTKAVTVNPRSYSSWYALGYTQYKLKMLPDAVESLSKSALLSKSSVNTYIMLGTIERLQKQWNAAETHLKRAKSLTKKPVSDIHWQLALLYNQTNRFAEAANELELFLKAQPDSRDSEKIKNLIGALRKKK